MKNAIILTRSNGSDGGFAPLETNPTVLGLVSANATLPFVDPFNTIAGSQSIGVPDSGGARLVNLGYVRVEDSVVIGDKLVSSDDVYHKFVE